MTLTYIEEDLEYSGNSMILGRDMKLPDDCTEELEVIDNWKKQQRCVQKCKEAAWKRWVHEYLAALREKYNLSHKEKPSENQYKLCGQDKRRQEESLKVEDRNYPEYFHGSGKNNQINQNMYWEERYWKNNSTAVSKELHCNSKATTSNTQDDKTLNFNAEEFRPKRSAAGVLEQRIRDIADKSVKDIWFASSSGEEQCGNI